MALTSKSTLIIKTSNHFIIILITFFILGLGYYFSMINLLGKEWLSRSGSLIVILGILSGFSGIIQERILLSKLEIRKRIELLQKKRKLRLLKVDKDFIEKELEDIENNFLEQTNELMNSIKFNVGLIEGVLLILGTMVWGFGDIALTLVQ
jgi:hypothetical protein